MAVFPYSKVMTEKYLKKDKYIIRKTKDKESVKNTMKLILGDWLMVSLITLIIFAPLTIIVDNHTINKTLTNLIILLAVGIPIIAYTIVETIISNRGHNFILSIVYLLFMMIPYTNNETTNILYGTITYTIMSILLFIILKYKLNKNGVFIIEDVKKEQESIQ